MISLIRGLLKPSKWVILGASSLFATFLFLELIWIITETDNVPIIIGGFLVLAGYLLMLVTLVTALLLNKHRLAKSMSGLALITIIVTQIFSVATSFNGTTNSGLLLGLGAGFKDNPKVAYVFNIIAGFSLLILAVLMFIAELFPEGKAIPVLRFIGLWTIAGYSVMKIVGVIVALSNAFTIKWGMVMDLLAVLCVCVLLFFLYAEIVLRPMADKAPVAKKRIKKVVYIDVDEEAAPAEARKEEAKAESEKEIEPEVEEEIKEEPKPEVEKEPVKQPARKPRKKAAEK